jgi:hypothetical protein
MKVDSLSSYFFVSPHVAYLMSSFLCSLMQGSYFIAGASCIFGYNLSSCVDESRSMYRRSVLLILMIIYFNLV